MLSEAWAAGLYSLYSCLLRVCRGFVGASLALAFSAAHLLAARAAQYGCRGCRGCRGSVEGLYEGLEGLERVCKGSLETLQEGAVENLSRVCRGFVEVAKVLENCRESFGVL